MGKPRRKFNHSETIKFIHIWKHYISDLRNNKRNKKFYFALQNQLKKEGFFLDIEEIRNKVCNLSCKYKSERKKIIKYGKSTSYWEYYNIIHKVLGDFNSSISEHAKNEIKLESSTRELGSPKSSILSASQVSQDSVEVFLKAKKRQTKEFPALVTLLLDSELENKATNYEKYLEVEIKMNDILNQMNKKLNKIMDCRNIP